MNKLVCIGLVLVISFLIIKELEDKALVELALERMEEPTEEWSM